MAEPITYLCRTIAPVPVGHRVELTWFERPVPALFGPSGRRVDEDEPLVRDLDTGVLYSAYWHHGSAVVGAAAETYGEAIDPALRAATHVVGRVTACRLVTIEATRLSIRAHTYLTVLAD